LLQRAFECLYLTFLTFLATTAIAMLLVKWTWIDMIINSGGIVFSSVVFVVVYYIIHTYFGLSNQVFWLNKKLGYIIITSSLLIIIATNGFHLQRLLTTPAIVIRNGFFLNGITIAQVNNILLLIFTLGVASTLVVVSKVKNEVRSHKGKLTIGQKRSVFVMISLGYLLMVVYTLQPTIRYLINGLFL